MKKWSFFLVVVSLAGFLWPLGLGVYYQNTQYAVDPRDGLEIQSPAARESFWSAASLDLSRIKSEGCVADGLLSGYDEEEVNIEVAKNSSCHYFHRALETWLEPPDFPQARRILTEINRPDAVYGMFIAEAIDRKADYFYRAENRYFDFGEMCKKHSKHFWGEHSCKPSLEEEEYRAYLKQITEDAMDLGIRVFVFGQLKHQEESYNFPKVDNVIREMRAYAQAHNIDILIGGQTGEVTKKSYLRHFDFIEGGIGVSKSGTIEPGPCFSRYWKQPGDWCWPLMWHAEFRDRADHVFLYLDWNGQLDDDMHTFASMPTNVRHRTLRNLHERFTSDDIGFFLPLLTPLPRDKSACRGPDQDFYSPSMDFGCPDEDAINQILRQN